MMISSQCDESSLDDTPTGHHHSQPLAARSALTGETALKYSHAWSAESAVDGRKGGGGGG